MNRCLSHPLEHLNHLEGSGARNLKKNRMNRKEFLFFERPDDFR